MLAILVTMVQLAGLQHFPQHSKMHGQLEQAGMCLKGQAGIWSFAGLFSVSKHYCTAMCFKLVAVLECPFLIIAWSDKASFTEPYSKPCSRNFTKIEVPCMLHR